MKILSHANAKKKTERVSDFVLLLGRFSSDIMTVKGLIQTTDFALFRSLRWFRLGRVYFGLISVVVFMLFNINIHTRCRKMKLVNYVCEHLL